MTGDSGYVSSCQRGLMCKAIFISETLSGENKRVRQGMFEQNSFEYLCKGHLIVVMTGKGRNTTVIYRDNQMNP